MSVRSRGEKLESAIQVLILLGMGGLAGAVSFVHVHEWTTAHGQQSWVGWTNAMVTELIQIAGGLEIRRRKREGLPVGFVMGVLVVAVAVSLTAQVSQAEPSAAGWVVAALPALGFLTVVKIVMAKAAVTATRTVTQTVTAGPDLDRPVTVTAVRSDPTLTSGLPGPDRAGEVGPGHGPDPVLTRSDLDLVTTVQSTGHAVTPGPSPDPDLTPAATAAARTPELDLPDPGQLDPVATGPGHDRTPLDLDLDRDRSDRDRVTGPHAVTASDLTGEFDPDLTARGHQVLTELTAAGVKVNRGTFAMGLRRSGQPIQTNTAGHLLRALQKATA